jgi:flavin reductase (DIM6/NTAB) family NADH-FMN oxidoreductase RutF
MELTGETFRTVMGHFVTGVTVVTTFGEDDTPQGITVNALTSVSLDPPLVVVALDRRRFIHPALRARGRYAVNVLAEDQQALAECFAGAPGKPGEPEREAFCGAPWQAGETGLPLLDGAIATLECTTAAIIPAGDHDLFIARVEALVTAPHAVGPLLYYRRQYLALAPEDAVDPAHRLAGAGPSVRR